MKLILYSILVSFILFTACVPEMEHLEIQYFIRISGVSANTVKVDDTLDIYIDWVNSRINDQLTLTFDSIQAKVIGLKNDTTIAVIVPSGWNDGILEICHPNGAKNTWSKINKNNFPQVYSVYPTKGITNDLISITGKEFLASKKTGVRINTIDCEIIELQDSLITFKVPEGCGNGPIKILYWVTDGCEADKIIDAGLFSFDKQIIEPHKVKKYSESGFSFLLERDINGNAVKRIHLNNDGTTSTIYDKFIYGTDGLIETISTFTNDIRVSYKAYSRSTDLSVLEVAKYNNNNELIERHEYQYLDGKIVQYKFYLPQDNVYCLHFKNEYTYSGEKENLVKTFYNNDGQLDHIEEYKNMELDHFNGPLPNLGIPGYEIINLYPYTRIGSIIYKTIYNSNGELIKVDEYNNCEYIATKYIYEYD